MEYICPHCKNPIYDDDALLCHFCGESLCRSGDGFLSKFKYSEAKFAWYVAGFLALLSFFLFTLFW